MFIKPELFPERVWMTRHQILMTAPFKGTTLDKLIKEGKILPVRMGSRKVLVNRKSYEDYMSSLPEVV